MMSCVCDRFCSLPLRLYYSPQIMIFKAMIPSSFVSGYHRFGGTFAFIFRHEACRLRNWLSCIGKLQIRDH
jgi:hypothetical protein